MTHSKQHLMADALKAQRMVVTASGLDLYATVDLILRAEQI